MKIVRNSKKIYFENGSGIGLGNFDGVHTAHEVLIRELVKQCSLKKLPSIIYTFKDHPGNILQKRNIKLISTLEKRIEKFKKLGVDYLILENFTDEYAGMEPNEFVEKILIKRYNAKLIVTGFNYNFGSGGRGNTELLQALGEKNGFELHLIEPVMAGDDVISSSAIREFIKNGQMLKAKNMLGEYYSIRGKVEYGNRIGTLIGFPTANIIPIKDFALPESGVYFTRTEIDGKVYNSITNIGTKPTIENTKNVIIETHVFDFSGWLYGKEIQVSFLVKHRDEMKHKDIIELKNRIEKDISEAKDFFSSYDYL